MLISNSPQGLQSHLNTLKVFCRDRGLFVNMGKTKVVVFNSTQAWVTSLMLEVLSVTPLKHATEPQLLKSGNPLH